MMCAIYCLCIFYVDCRINGVYPFFCASRVLDVIKKHFFVKHEKFRASCEGFHQLNWVGPPKQHAVSVGNK